MNRKDCINNLIQTDKKLYPYAIHHFQKSQQ